MYFDKLDIKLWKDVQEKFSRELDIPFYTIDMDGKMVAVSGNIPFLVDLVISKRPSIFEDANMDVLRDLEEGDVALHNLFGVVHLIRPVYLYDRKIGAVICGPIKTEKFDYKSLATRLSVGEDELSGAADDILNKDDKEIKLYRKVISVLAVIAPKLAHQKQTRDTKISKLTALYNIIRKVNSTLELDDILRYIMEFLVDTLDATDCSVCVYGEDGDREDRYQLSDKVKSMIKIEKNVSQKSLDEKQPVVVKDISQRFRLDVESDYNSMISIPLILRGNPIGSISIYGKSVGWVDEDSLDFLLAMAGQVAIAVDNAKRFGEVKELAVVDKLTGTFNRRHFTDLLDKELEKEIGVEHQLGLILLDIDNFGKYNNTHGHPKGDDLLKELSRIIKDNSRDCDSVGRYGGEEFIILLPDVNPTIALKIAEKIKKAVAEYPFYGRETQPEGKVTISAGLAISRAKISARMFIDEADEALYRAKNSGKNKVVQRIILKDNLKTEI